MFRMLKYWSRMVDIGWFLVLQMDNQSLANTMDLLLRQAYRRWYCDIVPWSGDPRIGSNRVTILISHGLVSDLDQATVSELKEPNCPDLQVVQLEDTGQSTTKTERRLPRWQRHWK